MMSSRNGGKSALCESQALKRVRVLLIKDEVPQKLYELSVPKYCGGIEVLQSFFSKDRVLKDNLESGMMAENYTVRVSAIDGTRQFELEVKPETIYAHVRVKAVDEPRYQYVIEVESPTFRSPQFDRFSKLFNRKEFSDVSLSMRHRTIHAHKIILANKSPVFHAMLKSSQCKNIQINDVDYDTMFDVLSFMYKGKIIIDAASDLFMRYSNLFRADEKFFVEGLRELCENKLAEMLTTENVLDCLILAESHSSLHFKEQTVKFIVENIQKIVKLPSYQRFAVLHSIVLATILQAVVLEQTNTH